jgi:hypothetical protein
LRVRFIFRAVAALCAALVLGGCAGSIERWIVNTRVHQGDVALLQGSVRDAATSYRLGAARRPERRSRAGRIRQAAAELARLEFSKGDFDDALATVDGGLAVDPQSAPLAALKATIDQAKLKREIVVSNYPTYRATGLEIARAYQQLDATNALLRRDLRRFAYTFDTDDLTSAIKRSYELELEVAKDTNRLIVYRQLVSSGCRRCRRSPRRSAPRRCCRCHKQGRINDRLARIVADAGRRPSDRRRVRRFDTLDGLFRRHVYARERSARSTTIAPASSSQLSASSMPSCWHSSQSVPGSGSTRPRREATRKRKPSRRSTATRNRFRTPKSCRRCCKPTFAP